MKTAILGLGSNLGDRLSLLRAACASLKKLPKTKIEVFSFLYETQPVGFLEQADFLNMLVKIKTGLSAPALLGACLGIEAALGRERNFENGPRHIDVDLLLYEGVSMNTQELTLPHPRMKERAFVLVPLKDIYPDLKFFEHCFMEDYHRLDKSGVRPLGPGAFDIKDVIK